MDNEFEKIQFLLDPCCAACSFKEMIRLMARVGSCLYCEKKPSIPAMYVVHAKERGLYLNHECLLFGLCKSHLTSVDVEEKIRNVLKQERLN